MKCPGDISIIGFDDVDLAELSYVPLTTIRVSKKKMGIRAAQKLIAIIEDQDFAGKECSGRAGCKAEHRKVSR